MLDKLLAGFVGKNNVDLLKGALRQTGSIIVGSVVLQSMLPSGEERYGWDDADLDIYTLQQLACYGRHYCTHGARAS